MKKGPYFKMAQIDDAKAEIFIYGDIVQDDYRWSDTETSAVSFRDALNELGDVSEINLHINSGGGDVFEAVAIHNMIKRHTARVNAYIDGLAASAASVIAMAADRLYMPSNSMLMIHNAWSLFMGDHNDFRKFADDLEKINNTVKQSYIDKNPDIDTEELSRLMDEETWLSANETVEMGLADEVITAVQVAASITKDQLARYEKAPSTLKGFVEDNKDSVAGITVKLDVDDGEFAESWKNLIQKVEDIENQVKQQNKNQKEEPAEPEKVSALSKFFLNLN